MKKRIRRIGIILLTLLVICAGGVWWYLSDYYHADETAAKAAEVIENDTVVLKAQGITDAQETKGETDAKIGFIFYPGGKVEYTAYIPLMERLCEKGISCFIPHLTGNLAFLEMNAADEIIKDHPEIEVWYLGGHSLGGVAASVYAKKHANDLNGLILLASYTAENLKETNLSVLSIYGTQDHVLNMDSYEKTKANLPSDYTELVIEGGCHAYFGNYGEQDGDGTATISRDVQQQKTSDAVKEFISKNT